MKFSVQIMPPYVPSLSHLLSQYHGPDKVDPGHGLPYSANLLWRSASAPRKHHPGPLLRRRDHAAPARSPPVEGGEREPP